MQVVVGVDSHKSTFAGAVVDEVARPVEAREFPNEPKGYRAFVRWAKSKGIVVRIGVECSETWGAPLTRFLLNAGEDVREVPTRLAYREANRRAAQGKSDLGDALAIARVVARDNALPSPRRPEVAEELKLLSDYRDQLRRSRNQFTNRIHKDLAIMRPGYQKLIPDLSGVRVMKKVLGLIGRDGSIRAQLMRHRVAEVQRIDKEVEDLKGDSGQGRRVGDHLDSTTGNRSSHGGQDHWRGGRHSQVQVKGCLWPHYRHGSNPGVIRHRGEVPIEPGRQPAPQSRSSLHGAYSGANPSQGQGICGSESLGGKVEAGGDQVPKETAGERRLQTDDGGR